MEHVLIALRHAKSAWDTDDDDHDRPLAARGRRDAVVAGEYLAEHDLRPDLVLCSTAQRTRETWDRAVLGGASAGEVRFVPEIYAASDDALVEVLRSVPESAGIVLMLGHAPGLPDLVERLAVHTGGPDWAKLDLKFPTAGLAVLDHSGSWRELDDQTCTLRSFVIPRG